VTVAQFKEGQGEWDSTVEQVFHRPGHAIEIERGGEHPDVGPGQLGAEPLHIVLLETFPWRLEPAVELALAGLYLELFRVIKLNFCPGLPYTLKKGIEDDGGVALVHVGA